MDEEFSGRIRDFEDKLKGTTSSEKKPRDLLRAIGLCIFVIIYLSNSNVVFYIYSYTGSFKNSATLKYLENN